MSRRTSYILLRVESFEKSNLVKKTMAELLKAMFEHYGVPKANVRIRDAKTSYYKPNEIFLTFESTLYIILRELKHHIDFVEKSTARTSREHFEREFYSYAFSCQESKKWINEYSDNVLIHQLDYVEVRDKMRVKGV